MYFFYGAIDEKIINKFRKPSLSNILRGGIKILKKKTPNTLSSYLSKTTQFEFSYRSQTHVKTKKKKKLKRIAIQIHPK